MKKALILVLSTSTLISIAQNSSQSFSLQEAQDYALKNSYFVQDKQLEYEKSKKIILETAAIGLPQVTFSADYTYNSQLAATPLPDGFASAEPDGKPDLVTFGVEHQTNATLNVSQLIFDASYIVALRATQVVKDLSSLNTDKEKIDVKMAVAKTYYYAIVAEESEKVAQENVTTLKKNLFETRQLYKNGFLEEQDVDQLEWLLINQESILTNSKRQTDLTKKVLKFQMGMPLETEIVMEDDLDKIMGDNEAEKALLTESFNLENHIDFQIIETQRKAASLQLNNQRNTFYPSLGGFIRHTESNFGNDGFNAFNFNTFWVPGTSLGLSLQWNLFTGMGRTARIQQARIDLDRVDLGIDLTKMSLQLEYTQNKSDYEYAFDVYNTQRRNVELSKRIRDRTRIKYKEGLSSSLDLTQVENQYLQSQSNYLTSIINLLSRKEDLKKILSK